MSALETVQVAQEWNVHMTRGDTLPVAVRVRNPDGTGVDVSTWTWTGHVREDFLLDSPIITELTIDMADAVNGNVSADLPSGVDVPVYTTADVGSEDVRGHVVTAADVGLPKPVVYDVQYTKPDGTTRTFVGGTITFDPDVTRT